MIDEVMESPAFWILAGAGVAMELIGWLVSKRMMEYSFPVWQLIAMMIGTIVAAGFFALKE